LAYSWRSGSVDVLRVLLPAGLPRAGEIRIDSGVIAFAIAISAAAGLLFGVLPALRCSGPNLNEALETASRAATAGRRAHRLQAALVVSEVSLSLVLVADAGLLAHSFGNCER
jgi:putative ABC transport system permease protein